MASFWAWFGSLPRSARWGAFAVAGALAYFSVVEPIMDRTNEWNSDADVSKLGIDKAVEQAGRRSEADNTMALNISQYGEVLLPGEFQVVSKDLDVVVDAAMKSRGLSGYRTNKRKPTPLGRDVMSSVVPANKSVQRIGVEVTFEATQEQVASIVAELEKSSNITLISEVNLKVGSDKKKVQATLVPEAWIYVESGVKR